VTVQSELVTLTTSESSLAGNGTHGTIHVTVRSLSGVNYVGASGLTSADGFQLTTDGAAMAIRLNVGEQLFGYSTSGSVAVLRTVDTT
jgi:hypothetical protein